MKSSNGITLISIMIYVVVMVIVVSTMAVITGYFYKNVDIGNETYNSSEQYTSFNSYFSDEVNRKNNKIIDEGIKDNQKYIVFSSGNQYTFIKENKAIYRNNVKIASNIYECNFITDIKNGKNIISVNLLIGKDNLNMNTTYALSN